MATEIKVPVLGESISEATVTTWLKSVGDSVAADEPILELETDKVTMEGMPLHLVRSRISLPILGQMSRLAPYLA